ncbi:heme lyase CcmF/NrfE family subunit [Phenylobacterium sp.]|uniref:heme lyase CcmF/NrfE family subunit n=1 Tax=Phenylobacterium sp. TaxID=1871053 RepID=UPI00301D180D
MSAEVGQFALILALLLSAVQTVAPLYGAHRGDGVLMAVGRQAAILQGLFVAIAFACLVYGYATCDFSMALVAQHSHTTQPLAYRIAASWGSHEGSMLLWVLILAVYGAGVAGFGGTLRETLQARVLSVQGVLGLAFLSFLIFTSNPFLRLSPAPIEGTELNPLLQDPGLVLHPPLLYLGYVGFSVAFCFAVAALLEGRVDAAWARWIRPWVLAAWAPLTAGITLGSGWAYYELGWGGWWFWDPVENASLMPWLLGTALLHSALVLERRGALASWTILLAILTFSLSLVGTFLVRSGILTSVHAFAVDPQRGVYILGILAATTGASLALYAWRAPALRAGALFQPVSREGGVTLNNLFLTALTATVFLGTFSPVFIEMLNGDKISVGPPYYNRTFAPLAVPLMMLVVFGPMLNWKRDEAKRVLQRVRVPAILAGVALILAVVLGGLDHLLAAGGIALGAWLLFGSLAVLARRWWAGRGYLARSILTTPRAVVGLVIAHAGLGLLVIGVTGTTAWDSEKVLNMRPGQTIEFAGRSLTMTALETVQGPNYQARQARFSVGDRFGAYRFRSERRFYPSAQSQTTEAAIRVGFTGNFYVSIGEESPGGIVVRMWSHPLIVWIWIGGFAMSIGGLVSLSDRRLRVGAAVRAPLPAAPHPLPAE